MSETYFTSDLHFGHINIIKYCNRPFGSVEDMNSTIIENWNSVVKKGDTVYHLGDFSFGDKDPYHWLDKLNGNIILLQGNHDRKFNKALGHGAIILKEKEYMIDVDGVLVLISHYPPKENRDLHGVYLYGHTHKDVTPNNVWAHHVGCDDWNFTPQTLKQIWERNNEG